MIDNVNRSFGEKLKALLLDNIVMFIFIIFVTFGLVVSDISPHAFTNDLTTRFFRNGVLVLSLIIPVMAGLGLNFGIVVGAIAGILSIILVRYNYEVFHGIGALMLTFAIATPIAILFGWFTGMLYNKTRGQEMIAGLIVSFFATGALLVFGLFVIGGIIPVRAGHRMINPGEAGIGIRGSFELGLPAGEATGRGMQDQFPGMARALNNIWRVEFVYALLAIAVVLLAFLIIRRVYMKKNPTAAAAINEPFWAFCVKGVLCFALFAFALYSSAVIYHWYTVLQNTPGVDRLDHLPGISNFAVEISRIDPFPVVTGIVIAVVGLFIVYFAKTKLGQDCRSVGQSQPIANVSGINVDRTRIVATMISTVLAAWGMIILVQDMGHVSTYTMHAQIGFLSVAAILVGGATAAKASVKNAMVGLVLFHAMIIVSPAVGIFLFDSAAAGEYMRTFMLYGVIGFSLGLYVWKANKAARDKERLR